MKPEDRPDPEVLVRNFRARALRLGMLAVKHMTSSRWTDAKIALVEAGECLGKATSIALETETETKDMDR